MKWKRKVMRQQEKAKIKEDGLMKSMTGLLRHYSSMGKIGTKFISMLVQGLVHKPDHMRKSTLINWIRKAQKEANEELKLF